MGTFVKLHLILTARVVLGTAWVASKRHVVGHLLHNSLSCPTVALGV
jgi:hypothetical protein